MIFMNLIKNSCISPNVNLSLEIKKNKKIIEQLLFFFIYIYTHIQMQILMLFGLKYY